MRTDAPGRPTPSSEKTHQTLCTGCKACQVACKDKHDLPVGVTWRRVVEYSGGSWQTNEADHTVTPNVFTYYTSISCNHCEDPLCVQVCPTTAMTQRDDGTVFVDQSKCVGCRYCEWACAYGAPQFNAEAGHMTKCDLCYDYRQSGQDPACVAACPSRALEWGPIDALRAAHGDEAGIAPLPDPAITHPRLVIKPHRDAQKWDQADGHIANPKEI
ncbi:dimethylsulfoxide reductase subunit B [Propionibacterium freudenreichii]|uniref:DMSO/selenate family reductase complex B subunit n=1 Tax=Propionibacterium freudenreichii TaxID=1744 RepID=UPI000BEF16B7|nr:DMSO/selenate family reductase complex B subunit [Propionibacterium freudenreichii]MDK9346047.1 dimethylsulfoxide reductase subunit B [Propionibacterium freudenreichii]